MPSEQPNENMDKVLKAYAQKRRDESDQFELDLATRNMLQAEVQRKLGKVPVAAQPARPRFAWWPQIIMGVACTAALALAFIMWKLPAHEPTFAAKSLSQSAPAVTAPIIHSVQSESLADKSIAKKETVAPSTLGTRSEDEAKLNAARELNKASPPPSIAVDSGIRNTSEPVITYNTAGGELYKGVPPPSITLDAEKQAASPPVLSLNIDGAERRKDSADFKTFGASNFSWQKNGVDLSANSFVTDSVVVTNGIGGKQEDLALLQELPKKSFAERSDGIELGAKRDIAAATPSPATTPTPATPAAGPIATSRAVELDSITRHPSGTAESHGTTLTVGATTTRSVENLNWNAQQQRLRFSQIDNRAQYRANVNSPALPKVLTNFGLERNGSNVVVRDADGSVYSGNILVSNDAYKTQASSYGVGGNLNGSNNILLNENNAQDNYAFRVSGYNNRVRAKVIFTGNITNVFTNNLLNGSNQNFFARQQQQNALQQNVQNQAAGAFQQNSTQNLLLNGRVQIGKSTEFDIQAEPTTK